MDERVHYQSDGKVSTLTLDDGKVNVMSLEMLQAIDAALDRAQAEGTVVVIAGRPGVFSAGFDLGTLQRGGTAAGDMLEAGARLTERLLSFPAPMLAAVTGPAMAMGAFVALGADVRLGVSDGRVKIAANEVAIGLTLPRFATALLRHRLTPAHFDRAAITSQPCDAQRALAAGWLDELVPTAELMQAVQTAAMALAALDRKAHVATKLRVREPVLTALREGIAADVADWRRRG